MQPSVTIRLKGLQERSKTSPWPVASTVPMTWAQGQSPPVSLSVTRAGRGVHPHTSANDTELGGGAEPSEHRVLMERSWWIRVLSTHPAALTATKTSEDLASGCLS